MKRLTFASLLFLMPVLVAVVGCNSRNDSPTGSDLQVGDTTSAVFEFIDSTINGTDVIEDLGIPLNLSLALFQTLPGGSSSARQGGSIALGAQDSVEIGGVSSWDWTDDNWLVMQFEATIIEQNELGTSEVSVGGIDSVQFLIGDAVRDSASMWSDSSWNGIRVRMHGQVAGSDGASSFDGGAHRQLEILGDYGGNDSLGIVTAMSRDTLTFDLSDDSGSCEIMLVDHPTVSGLVMNVVEGECPRAGSISRTAGLSLDCQSADGLQQLNIDGTWTVSVVVNPDLSITLSYTDGTTQWTVTRQCED
ncbi:hypothetical protein KQH82_09055 [bacterium]|nr:hypothetical protein [bacterium]